MSTATSTSSTGGSLEFREPAAKGSQVNFWAKNIIVENGGKLIAGTAKAPYGSRAGVLTIYLYGANQSKGLDPNVDANQGQGVLCQTDTIDRWGRALRHPDQEDRRQGYRWRLEQQRRDSGQDPRLPRERLFLPVWPLARGHEVHEPGQPGRPDPGALEGHQGIGACTNPKFQAGYFGYKVLGVSYGGTLQLFGYKGTPLPKAPPRRRHA